MKAVVEFGTPNTHHATSTEGSRYVLEFKDLPYLRGEPNVAPESDPLVDDHKRPRKCLDIAQARTGFVNGYDPERQDIPDLSEKNIVLELIAAKLCCPLSRGQTSNATPSPSPSSPIRATRSTGRISKRYVSYSILVKETPGLDTQPSVIERRFSDFLTLFQAIKNDSSLAQILDSNRVNFPKKIIVGNFSAINIAERSMEFDRLLHLCMSEPQIRYSASFASFLMDRELREAQELYLENDLCEAQAVIENAYHIGGKLYISHLKEVLTEQLNEEPSNKPRINGNVPNVTSARLTEYISQGNGSSKVLGGRSIHLENPDIISICYRLLITFALLTVIYCEKQCQKAIELTFIQFNTLISSQDCFDCMAKSCPSILVALLVLFSNTSDTISSVNKENFEKRLKELKIRANDPDLTTDNNLVDIIRRKPLIP